MHKHILAFTIFIFVSISAFAQVNPLIVNDSRNIDPLRHLAGDTTYLVNGVWSPLNPLPAPNAGVNAVYWEPLSKVFICGGINDSSQLSASCYWFDPAANSYSAAASLPTGRWAGKLVKVKDALYLVGSINNFSAPDGLIYRYTPATDQWQLMDTMPIPFVHESAVCVLNDSLIVSIGGSTAGYSSPRNFIRLYNASTNTWASNAGTFPINITSSHAEVFTNETDTAMYIVGGYSAGNLNTVYEGLTVLSDSLILITWELKGQTPFGLGVYRPAGGKWKNYLIFGPGLNASTPINTMWGMTGDTAGDPVWSSFLPNAPDSIANISTFGISTGPDSNYFYLFGGYSRGTTVSNAQKYSFVTPVPIGIQQTGTTVPSDFMLYQNYPNPFNPVTKIRFDISNVNNNSPAEFFVYDLLGRMVKYESLGNLNPGIYEYSFDASGLSSGVYFYSLRKGDLMKTKRMILLK